MMGHVCNDIRVCMIAGIFMLIIGAFVLVICAFVLTAGAFALMIPRAHRHRRRCVASLVVRHCSLATGHGSRVTGHRFPSPSLTFPYLASPPSHRPSPSLFPDPISTPSSLSPSYYLPSPSLFPDPISTPSSLSPHLAHRLARQVAAHAARARRPRLRRHTTLELHLFC
eukprot:365618-Chlamydomonas_euryale.AAC.7